MGFHLMCDVIAYTCLKAIHLYMEPFATISCWAIQRQLTMKCWICSAFVVPTSCRAFRPGLTHYAMKREEACLRDKLNA